MVWTPEDLAESSLPEISMKILFEGKGEEKVVDVGFLKISEENFGFHEKKENVRKKKNFFG